MHIAVIGGGFMGMSLAYFLSEAGQHVTVLEQSQSLGGLHHGVEIAASVKINRFPHYLSPRDSGVMQLIRRLNLESELKTSPADSGLIHHGNIFPLRTLRDLLRFDLLPFGSRLRLARTILEARLHWDHDSLDAIPAKDWLIRVGGRQNFEQIWAPMLEAKFDYAYDEVPATYIWSWLNRMTALRSGPQLRGTIAYLRRGPDSLVEAMAEAIKARGNEVKTATRVREIELYQHSLGRIRTHTGVMQFDVVIATVPTPEFGHLLLSADQGYLDSLARVEYLGLVCPMMVLDRPLSDFWTLNLTDPSSPFSSITQTPHPVDPALHVVYLPKYTGPDNDWMGVPDDSIREAWMVRLRQIYPSLRPEHIRHFMVNRSRHVDPVHYLNAMQQLPAIQTPYAGLYLANASQVYPQLPTSEAVVTHAQAVARQIITEGSPAVIKVPAA